MGSSENEERRMKVFVNFLSDLNTCLDNILKLIDSSGAESGLEGSKSTAIKTIQSLIMLSRDSDQRRELTLLKVAIETGEKDEIKNTIKSFYRSYDRYFKIKTN